MNIVIFGHVCLDKNTSENSRYLGPGSPSMFMHKIFRELPDCRLTIVASYGPDYLPFLKNINIYPPVPNSTNTLIYENIIKQGTRTQSALNLDNPPCASIDLPLQQLIFQADILFFAPLQPNITPAYVKKFVSFANSKTLKVFLPQGYYRQFQSDGEVLLRNFSEADQILPFFDVIITSEQDVPEMIDKAKNYAQKFPLIWLVTQEEKGALAVTSTESIILPTVAVPASAIIDSVGAGDVFSAAFAYRYFKTKNISESGHFANSLARQRLFFSTDKIKFNINF
ncbi:MAG: PfkB family carbohydrate kinase [Candidatus Beckwithbacteria bacterium]|nr:PfkB family carbohydrate kinase [Candidatus Beckwithbacteria bacterium]